MEDMDQKMSALLARLDASASTQKIEPCEHCDDNRVSPANHYPIPVTHLPLEHGAMVAWRSSPERADHSDSISTITVPSCAQTGPSDAPAEPQLSRKRPHAGSLGEEPLERESTKRIRHISPQADGPLENNSFTGTLDPQDPHPPVGSDTSQSGTGIGHGGLSDSPSATADGTWSGSTGDGIVNVSEPEAETVHPSGKNEDRAANCPAATLQDFALPLTERLGDVGRSNASEHRESLRPPSSGHPTPTQTTHAALTPAEKASASCASQDAFDALRRENASLRAETSAMRTQIAEILNRLNGLSPSQAS